MGYFVTNLACVEVYTDGNSVEEALANAFPQATFRPMRDDESPWLTPHVTVRSPSRGTGSGRLWRFVVTSSLTQTLVSPT